MWVDLPLGDIADRISILDLKVSRLVDAQARVQCRARRNELVASWRDAGLPELDEVTGWDRLSQVNAALWEVEDALRAMEARGHFGPEFIEAARRVYRLNDERAALKRAIDEALGSRWREWKSHGLADGTRPSVDAT